MAEDIVTLHLTVEEAQLWGFTDEEIEQAKRGEVIRAKRRPFTSIEAPAPSITPQLWNLIQIAESAITQPTNAEVVSSLKTAVNEFTPSNDLEGALFTAAVEFARSHRAHTLFNDSMDEAVAKLKRAVADVRAPAPKADPYAEEPYLYILMRNDLASMNPGKAVAQGSHGANQMVFEALAGTNRDEDPKVRLRKVALAIIEALDGDPDPRAHLLLEWMTAANGFGTAIVLSVNEAEMRETVSVAQAAGLHAGLCHDPTYPLKDGKALHLIPLDTCGYVFGKKGECKPFVGGFSLMP